MAEATVHPSISNHNMCYIRRLLSVELKLPSYLRTFLEKYHVKSELRGFFSLSLLVWVWSITR
jgi:hypothetical protein